LQRLHQESLQSELVQFLVARSGHPKPRTDPTELLPRNLLPEVASIIPLLVDSVVHLHGKHAALSPQHQLQPPGAPSVLAFEESQQASKEGASIPLHVRRDALANRQAIVSFVLEVELPPPRQRQEACMRSQQVQSCPTNLRPFSRIRKH